MTDNTPEEMSDSEMWAAIKAEGQKKRWSNYEKSCQILKDRGIPFKVLSEGGGHLRVGDHWSFWPTTGKFYNQKTKEKGRGVFNLINKLSPSK